MRSGGVDGVYVDIVWLPVRRRRVWGGHWSPWFVQWEGHGHGHDERATGSENDGQYLCFCSLDLQPILREDTFIQFHDIREPANIHSSFHPCYYFHCMYLL